MYATVRPRKAVATVSRGFISSYSCNRGYASYRSLTPAYVLSPAGAGSMLGKLLFVVAYRKATVCQDGGLSARGACPDLLLTL